MKSKIENLRTTEFIMHNSFIAGVDIGGSHITVALVDAHKRKIVKGTLKRKKVDSSADAQSILIGWLEVIKESYRVFDISPCRIGIAMPGPFDYEEGISLIKEQNKYNSLYGINVKEWLSSHLQIKKENIVFNNDASCFLQGEVFSGIAKDFDAVLGLTLGTGLGSSRFIDMNAADADLWHHPFKDGIAEDYLSTRWFTKRFFDLSGKKIANVKELVDIKESNADPLLLQIFQEFGINLAEFLVPIIKSEKLQLVILGGNIAKTYPLFSSAMKNKLHNNHIRIDIKQTTLWENAALLGAASYCSNFTNAQFASK